MSVPWRFLLTTLDTGQVLSNLTPVATDRTVTQLLNQPWLATGKAFSDDVRVNNLAGDGDPNLEAGNRGLVCLRRSGGTPPWVPQFHGPVLQVNDETDELRATTSFSAFGPDKLWDGRPVIIDLGGGTLGLVPEAGKTFTSTDGAAIAMTLLDKAWTDYAARNPSASAAEASCRIDWGAAHGGTSHWGGTIATTGSISVNLDHGLMLGPSLRELCASGAFDIVITPIWDPVNRPGWMAEGSIVTLAGSTRHGAVFGWGQPPHNIAKLSRLVDRGPGALINVAKLYPADAADTDVAKASDSSSVTKYGESWLLDAEPQNETPADVAVLRDLVITLAKQGKTVVQVSPDPTRGPVPLDAYGLGDKVPIYASKKFRRAIAGDLLRVSGIPFLIGDDAVERVEHLITSADGGF